MSTGAKQKQASGTPPSRAASVLPSGTTFKGPFDARLADVNAWLETHLDWAMWAVVLIGFYFRVRLAGLTYLNTDEAQIMIPPLQHGLVNVYKAALPMVHAPLVSFLLYFMTFFGNSELYLRMPEVLCGALLAFVGYKWAAETFGKGAGVVTGCFIAFAPPLVILSASLRSYMMQALFMVCSLYCLERAFREKSARWMGLFGASALLATLTDYMSVFYLAGAWHICGHPHHTERASEIFGSPLGNYADGRAAGVNGWVFYSVSQFSRKAPGALCPRGLAA